MSDDFERGQREAKIDSILDAHDERLVHLDKAIDRNAAASLEIAAAVRELSSDIRTLQEANRIGAERLTVARDTLATETERRRSELQTVAETGDRKFSRREKFVGFGLTAAVAIIGFYYRHSLAQGGTP